MVSILIARGLGPEKQGYIAFILLIISIIASFSSFGINNATIYFLKRPEYSEKKIFRTNTSYLFINYIIVSFVFVLLYYYKIILSDYPYHYIIGALIYIFSSYIVSNHNLFFLGKEKIVESNKYSLQAFFVKSVLITLLFIFSYLNAWSYYLICVLILPLNAYLLHRKINFTFKFQIDKTLLKEEFSRGIVMYLSSLCVFLHYRVDQILIKYMQGNADLAVYTIAVTLAELLFVIPTSVNSALAARLINCDSTESKRKTTSQTIKYTFYICLILCFAGMAGSLLIPYVYGIAYKKAILSTVILLGGIIFASIGRISSPYFYTENKAKFHLVITFLTLIINLILNFLFIPSFGIYGAALASSVSYLIFGVYYIYLFIKKEHFKLRDFFIFEKNEINNLIQLIKDYRFDTRSRA